MFHLIKLPPQLKLICLAVLILLSFSLSAIFQEKVLRKPYGNDENSERFSFAFAFTAVLCVNYAIFAKGAMSTHDHPKNETPQKYFCFIAISYCIGKVAGYSALKYVPYPFLVVGKCSKPIPVMILGVLIGRKSYTLTKYFFVLIVIIGVILFSFKEKYDKKDGEDPILALIFISISLTADGFTGALEDRMRAVAKTPTSLNLMFFLNIYNSLYLSIALIFTGEGIEFFKFCTRHPIVLRDIGIVILVGIFGELSVATVITEFGALPVSIITTIRKFVTVFLSVIIFGHDLSVRQWLAASMIFTALFLDGYFSRRSFKNTNDEENNQKEIVSERTEITQM